MKTLIFVICLIILAHIIASSIENNKNVYNRKEHTQYYKEGFTGAIYCIETTHDIDLCKKLIKE